MGQSNAAVRVADVNGDGHPDLIASSEIVQELSGSYTAGNTVSVALGDGKGNFGLAHVYGGNSEALSLAVADFQGNGYPSIVTADIDTDSATVYLNDSHGNFGFPQGVFADQTSQGLSVVTDSNYSFADLNGDGKPDIFQIGSGSDFYLKAFSTMARDISTHPWRLPLGPEPPFRFWATIGWEIFATPVIWIWSVSEPIPPTQQVRR